jgi:hypothetical protein
MISGRFKPVPSSVQVDFIEYEANMHEVTFEKVRAAFEGRKSREMMKQK